MAMEYDALLAAHLAESPSARAERTVGAVDLVDLLSTERARFKAQAVAQCVRAANVPPVKNLKTAKPFTKPDAKRWWQPMKEYLTKLAADKAASADQSQPASPIRCRKRPAGRKRSRSPSSRRLSPGRKRVRKSTRDGSGCLSPVTLRRSLNLRMTSRGETSRKRFYALPV